MAVSDHGDQLLREMKQARGYDSFYPQALAKDEGLPIKYRELVALGILAFRGGCGRRADQSYSSGVPARRDTR